MASIYWCATTLLLHLTYWSVLFCLWVVEAICFSSFESFLVQLPPLPRSLLSPDTHPQALSSLWSSHHLSALAQGPPSRLISGLCCVQAHTSKGCWLFHGNGVVLSILSFGLEAGLHGYKNPEQQVLDGKVGLRTVWRSSLVMKMNRLRCPLTECHKPWQW